MSLLVLFPPAPAQSLRVANGLPAIGHPNFAPDKSSTTSLVAEASGGFGSKKPLVIDMNKIREKFNILGDKPAIPVQQPRPRRSVSALWSGTNKNRDVSTGPLARPFARSLAPLTRSLAPDCLLRSRPPLRSLVRSLRSIPRSRESELSYGYFVCVSFYFRP